MRATARVIARAAPAAQGRATDGPHHAGESGYWRRRAGAAPSTAVRRHSTVLRLITSARWRMAAMRTATAFRSAARTTLRPTSSWNRLRTGALVREQNHGAAKVALLRKSAGELAVGLRIVAREEREARRNGPGLAPTTCGRSGRGR